MIEVVRLPYTRFRDRVDRPALTTKIEYRGQVFPEPFFSIVDSGADRCAFPAIFGRFIGTDVSTGEAVNVSGVTGGSTGYQHEIRVWVQINEIWYNFFCHAVFLQDLDQHGQGILGHRGFFDLIESVSLDSKRKFIELRIDTP